MQVGAGDDVAALVLGAQFDAFQGHAMAAAFVPEMLAQAWLAHRIGFAGATEGLWPRAHLVRGVGDQAADGARAGAWQLAGGRPRQQQLMQLSFGQTRMQRKQVADLGHQRGGPLPPAAVCLGAVDPGTRAAALPPSALSRARHKYSLRRLNLNDSQAATKPCRRQKPRISSRRWALGAIIPQRNA